MSFRSYVAVVLAIAAGAGVVTPVAANPPLTVATTYKFSPYMDGQVGGSTGAGPEGRPVANDGWSGGGKSNLVLTPIGDGSQVMVFTQLNLITDDVSAIPNPGKNYNYILVAGLPPLDVTFGARIPEFGFSGNFQGLQVDAGAQGPNLSLDGTSALNDSNGARWYVVCSFFNGPPYNAMWAMDTSGTYPHTCWLAGKDPVTGKTPFRIRGGLWYMTTWAAVDPWLQSQEAQGLVTQENPAP